MDDQTRTGRLSSYAALLQQERTRRDFLRLMAAGGAGAWAATRGYRAAGAANLPAAQSGEAVFRIPSVEPAKPDPNLTSTRGEAYFDMATFDGLVSFDADNNAVPLVAEKWDVSEDGMTYTFHLRDGVKWTDGKPVTAGDFEYSWKRLPSPELASPYAATSYLIKGAEDYNTGKTTDPNTIGVKALDDKTLQVELTQPAAHFLRIAATWSLAPVPKWAIDAHGDKWVEPENLVCNGPFKLESWKHDQELVFVPNDSYWGEPAPLDKFTFTISSDLVTTSLPAYENNEIDLVQDFASADLDRVHNDATLSKELHSSPGSNTRFLVFDVSNTESPVSDVRVRQALYLALDRKKITQLAFQGLYDPAPTVTPEVIIGYNPDAALTGGVDKAKQLLADAGYPDGKDFPALSLLWGARADYDMLAQVLQQMWKETIEIDITLDRREAQAARAFTTSLTDPSIHYDFYISAWGSDYNDPYNWFNTLFESTADYYHTRWKNEEFDKLVNAASAELDPAKRKQLYEQAEVILLQDMPVLPIYHQPDMYLLKPYVQNFNTLDSKWITKVGIAQQ